MSSAINQVSIERQGTAFAGAVGDSDIWLARLPVAVLVGGCLNGWSASILHVIERGDAPWHAISPIEFFAIVAALLAMRTCAPPQHFPGIIISLVAAIGLLVPSSAVAWSVTGAYALLCSRRGPASWRQGALLFTALAACAVWSVLLQRYAIVPIATAEAYGVATVLGLLRADVTAIGNSVSVGDGHTIVVLTACSAAAAVPRVLLGVASVAVFLESANRRRFLLALAITGIAAFLAVEVRLDVMAWSPGIYDVVHGPIGSNLFDLLLIGLVLVGGTAASRR